MTRSGQIVGALSGPVGFFLFFIGMSPLAGHFTPPPSPSVSAAGIANFYAANAQGIRLAAILVTAAAACFGGFSGAITALLQRIEGASAPYAYIQLTGGIAGVVAFLVPAVIWSVAAFRPDRPADEILMLNDLAFLFLNLPAFLGVLQVLPTGLAILGDRSAALLLPRWLGYLNLVVGILFLPALGVAYVLNGPFAWTGWATNTVPALAFSVWTFAMAFAMIKASRRPV